MNLEDKVKNIETSEFWALPVCCNVKDSLIEDFRFGSEPKDSIFTISYKDNIVFKFKDFIDSDEFNLKLFDNKVSFEGQIPLVLYSDNLDCLIEAEKNIIFDLKSVNNYYSGNKKIVDFTTNKELGNYKMHNFYYKFGNCNNFSRDFLLVKVFFDSENLVIDASVDNIPFLKFFIRENFGIDEDKLIINSVSNYWNSYAFSISFPAILQGILIAKRTGKKVNVIYYKRHFSIINNFNLIFTGSNCLLEKNKLSKIVLEIKINRPLSFLYKFYFKVIKDIFNGLFFDGLLEFVFIENKGNFIFFYDNLLLFETSVYSFIYSNFYNLALTLSLEPLNYLISQINNNCNCNNFFRIFERLDFKNSLIKKSTVLNMNRHYNIFVTSRKGVGFSYLNSKNYGLLEDLFIYACLHEDRLDIFIPYSIVDNNLSNYMKNTLAKKLRLSYSSINFFVNGRTLKNSDFYNILIKEPYLLEKSILIIMDKFFSVINSEGMRGNDKYPVIIEEKIVTNFLNNFMLECSVELEFEFYSLSVTFKNVSFFVKQGNFFANFDLNSKRALIVFNLAIDYIFYGTNVNCDIKDFLSLGFIENGEFIFSFRSFFIASVVAIRGALIQAFDFNMYRTPIDLEEVLSNWSVKVDIG